MGGTTDFSLWECIKQSLCVIGLDKNQYTRKVQGGNAMRCNAETEQQTYRHNVWFTYTRIQIILQTFKTDPKKATALTT